MVDETELAVQVPDRPAHTMIVGEGHHTSKPGFTVAIHHLPGGGLDEFAWVVRTRTLKSNFVKTYGHVEIVSELGHEPYLVFVPPLPVTIVF